MYRKYYEDKGMNKGNYFKERGLSFIIEALIGACVALFFCFSCAGHKTYYEESGSVFHTLYHIKYESPTLLTDKIEAELQAFSLSLNPFHPHSIITKVNNNEDVEVDDWFLTVFNKAMEVSERSGGAFDVTVAPLINLWGFGFANSDAITQEKIDSILPFVGYRKIRIENRKVIKDDPRIQLNFSAIAKGYASDVIAALLEREGVNNYMVEIGGEVVVKGKNPNGLCWRVGINKPDDDAFGINTALENTAELCTPCGMATSGDYRNFRIIEGKKYGHTIDPITGYPSGQDILSATIIAPDCMTADAYATAFMAMGIEAASQMAETIPEIHYYLIYADPLTGNHKTLASPGMKSKLRIKSG